MTLNEGIQLVKVQIAFELASLCLDLILVVYPGLALLESSRYID